MLGNPQVFRERGLTYRIYFNEGLEPPHVHVVAGDDAAAKFWLDPLSMDWNRGLSRHQVHQAQEELRTRHVFFKEQWNAVQGRKR